MMEKKFDKDEALAKIKILINNFYEDCGREMIEDLDIERKQLIEDVDEVLSKTSISAKHLIIERIKFDNEKN